MNSRTNNHHHHHHQRRSTLLLCALGAVVVVFAVAHVLLLDTRALSSSLSHEATLQRPPTKLLSQSEFMSSPAANNHSKLLTTRKPHICFHALQEIFARQDCFLHQNRFPGEQQQASCEGMTATAAPVFQHSFMWGQGFGRIVQHGVKTCFLAALLHRPCVIDLVRDKYFNLRSFLSPGPFDWSAGNRLLVQKQHEEIYHALRLMPEGTEKGHGWEKLAHDKLPSYDTILPMVWGSDPPNRQTVQAHINMWDATTLGPHTDRILLSPNFGDAWYAYGKEYVRVPALWDKERRHGKDAHCTANHMTTFLQNSMFVPTSLAYELHRERQAQVLPSHPQEEGYGAIHLRMHILNRDVYHMNVTASQVTDGLRDCFDNLPSAIAPKHWWLISDDIQVAKIVAEKLPNVFSYVSSVGTDNKTAVKGTHSGFAVNQKFGQEALAPSMLDWMTLHQSQVALITHDSAYGETGARGSGKIRGMTCGGKVQKPGGRYSFPLFTIFEPISAP